MWRQKSYLKVNKDLTYTRKRYNFMCFQNDNNNTIFI